MSSTGLIIEQRTADREIDIFGYFDKLFGPQLDKQKIRSYKWKYCNTSPPPIMANKRLQHGSFSSSYRVVTNMFLTRCHFGAEVMYSTWTQVMYSTNQAKYQLSEEHLVTFVAPPIYYICSLYAENAEFLVFLIWLQKLNSHIPLVQAKDRFISTR